MKIKRLEIKGLFHTFDYDIAMPDGCEPLLVTGLNGYGKTTVLTIIKRLSEKDFYYFYILPFDVITLTFDTGSVLTILSENEQPHLDDNPDGFDNNLTRPRVLTFSWTSAAGQVSTFVLGKKEISSAVRRLRRLEQLLPHGIQSDEFYQRIRDDNAFWTEFREKDSFKLMSMMLDSLKVTFISAQRLEPVEVRQERLRPYMPVTVVYRPRISEVSRLIKEKLSFEKIEFLKASQRIDGQLIENLLADVPPLDEENYNILRKEITDKISDLRNFGLIESITIRPYDEAHNVVLSVYLRNTAEKLKVYDAILEKLKLFSRIVGNLRFVNKSVSYNPSDGLSIKTSEGLFLDESKLSSGEQNEIVMLYEMIFEVADNTVLLVDEPEISLHVAWQTTFVDTMADIAASKGLQTVIATHSPQIIGERWDGCYDLCEHSRK